MSTLYVVATPIGNLEDITLRALRILKEVDLIACEDTRRTRILVDRYEITTPVVSYHQHSKLQKIDWLVEQLLTGKDIALVSDAGTPGVNDPGQQLIAAVQRLACSDQRLETSIVPIPGANAGVTLLSVSGMPADQYLFLGYLPKKKGRQTLLKGLGSRVKGLESIPLVLYESPQRLVRTFEDFLKIFPEGRVVIGRELTKQFEEIWRGSLEEAFAYWSTRTVRGEFVLVVVANGK